MRITIIAMGSYGDVLPYVALGAGLRATGHTVRLTTHARFAPLARAHGLGFATLSGDPFELLHEVIDRTQARPGQRMLAWAPRMISVMMPVLHRMVDDCRGACEDAELILYNYMTLLIAVSIAERTGAIAVPAFVYPVHPTRRFAHLMLMPAPRWGGLGNALSYRLFDALFWRLFRAHLNRWRTGDLALPALSDNPLAALRSPPVPCLYGFSPAVLPRSPEWPDTAHLTGYWLTDGDAAWSPPATLSDFLRAGAPPVYIGFGSMKDVDAGALADIVAGALERSGQRAVLQTAWGALARIRARAEVVEIGTAPYEWLFPRMAAVVHHAGTGTTAAGLRAAAPTVAVPHFADQFIWASRIEALGAGPRPIPRKALTAARLAAAIDAAVHGTAMRENAARIGAALHREDGVAVAVRLIERIADAGRPRRRRRP